MTVPGPTTLVCRDVVELVSELLDGSLAAADRARLEQHLLVCPPCTNHVAQVRATIAELGELAAGPTEVGPAIVDLFRAWKKQKADDEP